MNDLHAYLKTVTKLTFIILSLCFLCWAILEAYRPYIAGFMLGVTVSLINAHYLSLKIRQLSQVVLGISGRRINLGFLTRAAIAVLAAMAAIQFEEHLSIMTTAAGIFFVPLASLIVGFMANNKE